MDNDGSIIRECIRRFREDRPAPLPYRTKISIDKFWWLNEHENNTNNTTNNQTLSYQEPSRQSENSKSRLSTYSNIPNYYIKDDYKKAGYYGRFDQSDEEYNEKFNIDYHYRLTDDKHNKNNIRSKDSSLTNSLASDLNSIDDLDIKTNNLLKKCEYLLKNRRMMDDDSKIFNPKSNSYIKNKLSNSIKSKNYQSTFDFDDDDDSEIEELINKSKKLTKSSKNMQGLTTSLLETIPSASSVSIASSPSSSSSSHSSKSGYASKLHQSPNKITELSESIEDLIQLTNSNRHILNAQNPDSDLSHTHYGKSNDDEDGGSEAYICTDVDGKGKGKAHHRPHAGHDTTRIPEVEAFRKSEDSSSSMVMFISPTSSLGSSPMKRYEVNTDKDNGHRINDLNSNNTSFSYDNDIYDSNHQDLNEEYAELHQENNDKKSDAFLYGGMQDTHGAHDMFEDDVIGEEEEVEVQEELEDASSLLEPREPLLPDREISISVRPFFDDIHNVEENINLSSMSLDIVFHRQGENTSNAPPSLPGKPSEQEVAGSGVVADALPVDYSYSPPMTSPREMEHSDGDDETHLSVNSQSNILPSEEKVNGRKFGNDYLDKILMGDNLPSTSLLSSGQIVANSSDTSYVQKPDYVATEERMNMNTPHLNDDIIAIGELQQSQIHKNHLAAVPILDHRDVAPYLYDPVVRELYARLSETRKNINRKQLHHNVKRK